MMFSVLESVALLVTTTVLFGGVAYWLARVAHADTAISKAQFLVANRSLGYSEAAFSIAATWIWAPALFVSAQQAYQHGWIGLFWFTVPNVACLLIFAYFADAIRKKFPAGFTLSEFIGNKLSRRVQYTYWGSLLGLTVCAFAVQLLAGGVFIEKLTGLPFAWATVALAVLPLAYSLVFGLKSSIVTDFAKMSLIIGLGVILVPAVILVGGGSEAILAGLGGTVSQNTDFFAPASWALFLSFGLPITIGLLSGPFGDQSFWQRAFAVERTKVKRSFVTAAFIFALVPLAMGAIGLLAAGNPGIAVASPQLVNVDTIYALAGVAGVAAFFLITMSALTSILDSKMSSVASIAGHDIASRFGLDYLTSARAAIVILAVAAVLVANIPGLKILHLFLFYGSIRSATLIPTICTILGKPLNEAATFYGILAALAVGLPVFAYGNFNAVPALIVTGSLLTVLIPGISNVVYHVYKKMAV